MERLKPCPDCGSVPWTRERPNLFEIMCKDEWHSVEVNRPTKEEAIDAWNNGMIRVNWWKVVETLGKT